MNDEGIKTNISDLKQKWIGKYCCSKKRNQIFKIVDLEVCNRTLTSFSVYAILDVIIGSSNIYHRRPLGNLILLDEDISILLAEIDKKIRDIKEK